jgi:hypothetical protein
MTDAKKFQSAVMATVGLWRWSTAICLSSTRRTRHHETIKPAPRLPLFSKNVSGNRNTLPCFNSLANHRMKPKTKCEYLQLAAFPPPHPPRSTAAT